MTRPRLIDFSITIPTPNVSCQLSRDDAADSVRDVGSSILCAIAKLNLHFVYFGTINPKGVGPSPFLQPSPIKPGVGCAQELLIEHLVHCMSNLHRVCPA